EVANCCYGLADGCERGHPGEDENLIGSQDEVCAHDWIKLLDSARSAARDPILEPRKETQRPVDELGSERAISNVELDGALELGIEGRSSKRFIGCDARENRGGNAAGIGDVHQPDRYHAEAPLP